jgi:hypothetical protein
MPVEEEYPPILANATLDDVLAAGKTANRA